MRFSNPRLPVVMGTSLLVFCIACQTPSGSQLPIVSLPKSVVTIESLRQPRRVKHSVTLMGSVTQRLAILNGWLYEVNDGTGQVWISTQQAAPDIGNQVRIQGVVYYQPVEINGTDLGDYYLKEEQRQLGPAAETQ
ncbi:MAG: hypothetical protein AAF959_23840 [Cyanobacteria bacterium P01_D01_bin.56]